MEASWLAWPLFGTCSRQPDSYEWRNRTGFHKWRSASALRIVEGLVDIESEVDLNRNLRTVHGVPLVKLIFKREFPRLLTDSFHSAGLTKLSPLLAEVVPRRNQEHVRMWGPLPIFTFLKYEGDEELQELSRDRHNSRNESRAAEQRRDLL